MTHGHPIEPVVSLNKAPSRPMGPEPKGRIMRIRLLSNSCTRGRSSWGQGELWLTGDALVRVGKPELTALPAVGLTDVLPGPHDFDVSGEAWASYLATQHDVMVLAFSQIVMAKLKAGLATSSLAVWLLHGRRAKLQWKRSSGALQAIRAVLPA
jgi:hypothetical protein